MPVLPPLVAVPWSPTAALLLPRLPLTRPGPLATPTPTPTLTLMMAGRWTIGHQAPSLTCSGVLALSESCSLPFPSQAPSKLHFFFPFLSERHGGRHLLHPRGTHERFDWRMSEHVAKLFARAAVTA